MLKKIKNEIGQSLVEFALVLPIMLILLGMVVDVARIIDAKIMLQNAASESARQIVTEDQMESEVNRVIAQYYDRLDASNLDLKVSKTNVKRRNYQYHSMTNQSMIFVNNPSYIDTFDATVELNYSVPIITPMCQLVLGKNFELNKKYTKLVVKNKFEW